MSRHTSNVLAGVMLAILLVASGGAVAQTKAQKAFLERVKSVSTIDDAKFSRDALVIWPSPCLLYTSPSPRDLSTSRMPSSA